MRARHFVWSDATGWTGDRAIRAQADLVLYFGGRQALSNAARFEEMRAIFPAACVFGCSAGGQIQGDGIFDDEIVALAMSFDSTRLKLVSEPVSNSEDSRSCGVRIGHALADGDLAGIFVLSDGLAVNGSELVAGMTSVTGTRVPITGGLAGDGADFDATLVGANDAPRQGRVAALGLYGTSIRIGHGCAGGWDVFGPRRQVTNAKGNVLFELDGQPALDLYERYLGEEDSKGLPGTALLFPLRICNPAQPENSVVRTVLAVDRVNRSMTFAGDVPQGWTAQLMRGNFDRLSAGAADAARLAQANVSPDAGEAESIAILVSCIGRRLLMGQHADDEIEAAGAELGNKTLRLGFYSYGEISPHVASGASELHNQTMAVTTLHEIAR